MSNFQELYDFVDRAKKNRKYPEATAQSLRAALKLYDGELSEEERGSLTKLKENFEQITQSAFNKNATKFTASSLATYKSRVLKIFSDFEKYGDPAKMNNWSPKLISRTKKKTPHPATGRGVNNSDQDDEGSGSVAEPNVFSDKGNVWSLVVRSKRPVSSEIKKKIVDIADLLNEINKEK